MPSAIDVPARRIEAKTSFLPSITRPVVTSIGVSTLISCIGMSARTS
ncbi:Uncharacterised protein [Mycobacteroides abscessus subsp. abscessus]|nr:Uncharacterised protein [Mycobacteroides abscessus subsp. abscessus]